MKNNDYEGLTLLFSVQVVTGIVTTLIEKNNHCYAAANRKHIASREWGYIGHKLCNDSRAIEKLAIYWKPQGTRRRGIHRKTLRRIVGKK